MRRQYSLRLGGLGLAAMAMAMFAPSASASVIGHLVVSSGDGTVKVSAGLIDWVGPSTCPQCLAVSSGTNITSVGEGNLLVDTTHPFTGTATINDLPGSPGIAGFMSLTGGTLTGTLKLDLADPNGFGFGFDIHKLRTLIGTSVFCDLV